MNDYLKTYELYHFGIPGMKWGVRRYQNKNGSLTSAGKKRYNEDTANNEVQKNTTNYSKLTKKAGKEYTKTSGTKGKAIGSIVGGVLGTGAGVALATKKALNEKKPDYSGKKSGTTKTVASFISKAIIGGVLGTGLGASAGEGIAKNAAIASYSSKGEQYTKSVLNEPINNLKKDY